MIIGSEVASALFPDGNAVGQNVLLVASNSMMNTLSVMLSGIAAIFLLVGGIGIMNIMIVTVTERRHEIDIRKELGASLWAICRRIHQRITFCYQYSSLFYCILLLSFSWHLLWFKSSPPC